MTLVRTPWHNGRAVGWEGWRRWAACRNVDTNLFFPRGATGLPAEQAEQAKAMCNGCSVIGRCLEFAIETNQEHGVWGGTTTEERRPLRRRWRLEQRRASLSG